MLGYGNAGRKSFSRMRGGAVRCGGSMSSEDDEGLFSAGTVNLERFHLTSAQGNINILITFFRPPPKGLDGDECEKSVRGRRMGRSPESCDFRCRGLLRNAPGRMVVVAKGPNKVDRYSSVRSTEDRMIEDAPGEEGLPRSIRQSGIRRKLAANNIDKECRAGGDRGFVVGDGEGGWVECGDV